MKCLKWLKNLKSKYKGLNLKEILKQNTDEFCQNTTLHGLKYVADNNLNASERYFFGFSVITVLCLAIYLIACVYNKWCTSPIIVAINPEPTFITDEPFPAVTICNLNQALSTKAEQFDKNSPEYAKLQLLCKREVNVTIVQAITNWNDLGSFIRNSSQPCESLLVHCIFGGRDYNCSHVFYPIVTDEGLCCAFNMLHPKYMYLANLPRSRYNYSNFAMHTPVDWYAEKGYPKDLPKLFYPQKVAGVGESVGLSIVLDVQQDKYYCSSSNSVGFKIAIHSPNESPNVREIGLLIENGKETKLRIRPVKTETEPHLRSIHRKFRHCLFHDEGNLKFFAHYTQRNCEMECVAEVTHKYCGCMSYFMPRTNANISVCNIYDAHCERKVLLRMDNGIKSCLDECLPSCYDLNFEADAFSTKVFHNGFEKTSSRIMNMSPSYIKDNLAVVHIYFKENSFRSSIQTEFVGISDFFSSIGGLMGLFLGFSFVSIAELIYFALIRPYHAIRQFRKSKDVYCRLENGNQMDSFQLKRMPLRKSNKQYGKYPYFPSSTSSSNIQLQKERLFKVKNSLPFLIGKDSDNRWKSNTSVWLD